MKKINSCGWFVYTVSCLAAGDESVKHQYNNVDVDALNDTLNTLRDSGFARYSRKGWATMNHPQLGMVQWKSGVDFRTASPFLFVRINGVLILRAWPEAGWKTVKVECPAYGDETPSIVREQLGRLGAKDYRAGR